MPFFRCSLPHQKSSSSPSSSSSVIMAGNVGFHKFHVVLYCNGQIVCDPTPLKYDGGDMELLVGFDSRTWGLGELVKRVHEKGVKNVAGYFWHPPNVDLTAGVKTLLTETDFEEFLSFTKPEELMRVYCLHTPMEWIFGKDGDCSYHEAMQEVDRDDGEQEGNTETNVVIYNEVQVGDNDDGHQEVVGGEIDNGPTFSDESDNEEENRGLDDPFQLDLVFRDVKELRNAVKDYAIKGMYSIRCVKSDSTRVIANCNGGKCSWKLNGSKKNKLKILRIVRYQPKHTCCSVVKNPQSTTKWITAKYLDTFRSEPNIEPKSLKERIEKDHNVKVSVKKCYRAKLDALNIIAGK